MNKHEDERPKLARGVEVKRVPLSASDCPEPCQVNPASASEPRVRAALFPKWEADTLINEYWHTTDDSFVDEEFAPEVLPSWLRDKTAKWIRACDYVFGKCATNIANVKGSNQTESQNQSKAWEEYDSDLSTGKLCPRIVVLPPEEQWPPAKSLPLDRGFAKVTPADGEDSFSSPEQDRVGASILRTVSTYAACSGPEGVPFLWEAIHPQDACGRPCYNPGGKYAVKVFLCGNWLKVLVDDRIPIDSSGCATIVSSCERRELWPIILCKAAYKVAHLAYRAQPQSEPRGIIDAVSEIVAIALSALTGWLPSLTSGLPISAEKLASQCIAGGTPTFSVDEITLATTAGAPEGLTRRLNQSSSRRRRGRSREPTEEMLCQAVLARKLAAAAVHSKLLAPRRQIVVVLQVDGHHPAHLRPLLALISSSTTGAVSKEEMPTCDGMLFDWSCAATRPADFSLGAAVPCINMNTVPLAEVVDYSGSISSILTFTTRHNMPFDAFYRHHWIPKASGTARRPPPSLMPTILHVEAINRPATLVINIESDIISLPLSSEHTVSNCSETRCTSPSQSTLVVLEEMATPILKLDARGIPMNTGNRDSPLENGTSNGSVVLRLALNTLDKSVPMMTTTILTIPQARQGRLYRVLIDASMGANAFFCCTSPVRCDHLPVVYESLGGSAEAFTGSHQIVNANQEVLLFRQVILSNDNSNDKILDKAQLLFGTMSLRNRPVAAGDILGPMACLPHIDIGLELWLSNSNASDHVTLHLFDLRTNRMTSHPFLRVFPLRIPHGGGFLVSATLRTSLHAAVAPGSWSLIAFSDRPEEFSRSALIQEIGNDGAAICMTRFGSLYEPNRQLRLFRDMIEIPYVCFPLYMKLNAAFGSDVGHRNIERLPLRFRIYEAENVSTESAGMASKRPSLVDQVGVGSVSLPWFCPPRQLHHMLGAAVEGMTSLSNSQFVIEAELDSDTMQVSKTRHSPHPYAHNTILPSGPRGDLSKGIQWVLTIYAGADSAQLRHDVKAEQVHQNLRRNWELNKSDRPEHATLIRAEFLTRRTIKGSSGDGTSARSSLLVNFATSACETDRAAKCSKLLREAPRVVTKNMYKCIVLTKKEHPVSHSLLNGEPSMFALHKSTATLEVKAKKNTKDIIEWRRLLKRGVVERLSSREEYRMSMQRRRAARQDENASAF